MPGSPPPVRAATMISRMTRVHSLPRFSSWRPLRCWILAHFECPAIRKRSWKTTLPGVMRSPGGIWGKRAF
jgi:hypothetical protein